MRDFKGMKRQRGRNRSGGGGGGGGGNSGGGGGGGGGKPSHNVNRAFDSNGPDNVKIRGHAQHVYEKYQQLARDASGAGDRVLAENYLQHAEHYFRVLRSIQPHRTVSEIIGRDALASGFDIDFEDENGDSGEDGENSGEGGEAGQGEDRSDNRDQGGNREQGGREPRGENQRNDNPRGDYRQEPRQDSRGERDTRDTRPDRQNTDRPNTGGPNNNNNNNGGQRDRYEPRGERSYGQGQGGRPERSNEGRNNNERRYEPRGDEPRAEAAPAVSPPRDPMPVVEPEAASPLLRSQDGGVSQAPAFLQTPTNAPALSEGDGEIRRPRTRTRRPKADVAPATEGSDE